MKCPFCGSENVHMFQSFDSIKKRISKTTHGGIMHEEDYDEYYPISKGVCLECGYGFQKMSDDTLKRYHDDEQYFAN